MHRSFQTQSSITFFFSNEECIVIDFFSTFKVLLKDLPELVVKDPRKDVYKLCLSVGLRVHESYLFY